LYISLINFILVIYQIWPRGFSSNLSFKKKIFCFCINTKFTHHCPSVVVDDSFIHQAQILFLYNCVKHLVIQMLSLHRITPNIYSFIQNFKNKNYFPWIIKLHIKCTIDVSQTLVITNKTFEFKILNIKSTIPMRMNKLICWMKII